MLEFSLTWQDVLWAAVIALFVTWILKGVITLIRAVITRSTEYEYTKKDEDDVIERCYEMFPIDQIPFNGETLRRGMRVCVVTLRRKKYEGRFIGVNQDNMVCVMTERSVVAQELDTIEEMHSV